MLLHGGDSAAAGVSITADMKRPRTLMMSDLLRVISGTHRNKKKSKKNERMPRNREA
jgi:hypothetical protein